MILLPPPFRLPVANVHLLQAMLAVGLSLAGACKPKPAPGTNGPSTAVVSTTAAPNMFAKEEPPGDPEKGKALVIQFECSRCHEGTGTPTLAMDKQCFTCHQKIASGDFKGPKGTEARWRGRVLDLQHVPSLLASQKRFRQSFITSFLQNPFDVRPRLNPTMPRLLITPQQARDIAAYLGGPGEGAVNTGIVGADPARGRALMEANGCASCHVFSGVPALAGAAPIKADDTNINAGLALAPDLRFARDRLRPDAAIAWVGNPKAVKPDTAMTEFNFAPNDARDIAAYILTTPLAPPKARAPKPRLSVLERPVRYDEVSTKVFRRTCWHCHGEPDYAAGDGGPGNTGGFGFKGRGINFVDYGSVASGRIDDQGERHSLFEKAADGTPRIIKSLLVRSDEETGHSSAEMRGMPLGYPSLTPEEIQLVESWVAQGRPR